MITKFLKSILALLIGGLSTLTGLLTILAALFLLSPGVLVNEVTFKQVPNVAKLFGIDVGWNAITVDVRSQSGLYKILDLKVTDFCFRMDTTQGCFDQADLVLGLNLKKPRFPIDQLGPGNFKEGSVQMRLEASTGDTAADKGVNLEALVSRLVDIRIEPLNMEIDSWTVLHQGERRQGRLLVQVDSHKDQDRWTLRAQGSNMLGVPVRDFDLDLTLSGLSRKNLTRVSLDGQLKAQLIDNGRLELTADLTPNDGSESEARFGIDARYIFGKQRVKLSSRGVVSPESATGRLTASVDHLSKALEAVKLDSCLFTLAYPPSRSLLLDLQTRCDGRVRRLAFKGEDSFQIIVPRNLLFSMQGSMKMRPADHGPFFTSKVDLDLVEIRSGAIQFTGGIAAIASGTFKNVPDSIRASVQMDLRAEIDDYSALVRQLEGTRWAIPAPLNVLHGSVRCAISGEYKTAKAITRVPVMCETDLESKSQSLDTKMVATVSFRNDKGRIQPNVRGDVIFNDVTVKLPDLSVRRAVPKVIQDKRIRVPKPENELPIDYYFNIRTQKPGSLKIDSDLAKKPVPLTVNLFHQKGQKLSGTIQVTDYRADLFRRQAFVDLLQLQLEPNTDMTELDGRILVEASDYDIELLLAGTLQEPRLKMYSNPPLPEQDIIALLLFGRRPGGLGGEQIRSVDETRAALADSAIGLISMYYLASTPIESVGYNPYTGMFSAQVRLAEDLSLTVGTGRESEGVLGLRKNLRGNWTIETTAVRDEKGESTKGIAVLSWSKRY